MDEFPLAPLDRINRVVMGGCFIFCGGALALSGLALPTGGPFVQLWLVAGLLLAVFAGAWAWSPRAVRVTPTGLVIVRRLLPPLTFPWSAFTSVETQTHWRGWKVCGSGGFYGYFGRYWGRDLGAFRCYATRRIEAVVLRGTPTVLVTPADPAELRRAIAPYVRAAA